MKRVGYLWEKCCTVERAIEATYRVIDGKTIHPSVTRRFGHPADAERIAENGRRIVAAMQNGTWRFHSPKHLMKPSASTGKIRDVNCPCIDDQIVHWMIMLTLEPIFMRGMVAHNCGSIKGRGSKHGLQNLKKWSKEEGRRYYAKLDMRHYYASIRHDLLKKQLRRYIKDARMLLLLDRLIDWYKPGLPLGNYTSQWFANFFLQPMDHYIQEDLYKLRRGVRVGYVCHYLRNMDDMIIVGSSKWDVGKSVRAIIERASSMGLTVKPCWEVKEWTDDRPVDILGFRIGRTYVELRSYIALHARRKARKCAKQRKYKGAIHPRTAAGMMALLGWVGRTDGTKFHRIYIKPYVKKSELREVLSNESKRGHPDNKRPGDPVK